MSPMRLPTTTVVCMAVVMTSAMWIYSSSADQNTGDFYGLEGFHSSLAEPTGMGLVIDSKTAKWAQFQEFVKEWRNQRGAVSSITEMSMLPSYQRIIAMGESVVPFLIAQLKSEGDEPDQWFWALRCLTDANPVNPKDQGDFQAMARAWIEWGEKQDYAG